MSEVNPRDFGLPGIWAWWTLGCDPENGNGYVMPGDIRRAIGGGGSLGIPKGREPWITETIHYTAYMAYVAKAGTKERYAKTKEKALQIASELLDCDGKVEIKRIELN